MKQLAILMVLAGTGSFAQEIFLSRDAIWVDTVKRGPMVRAVRGSGTITANNSVELKLPENQLAEVKPGQPVAIEPQTASTLQGRVARINPVVNGVATVLVELLQPTSLAPGTSVDGTIELERLNDAVYVGRPTAGQPNSEATIFKIDADGVHATKMRVRFGRPSLKTLQVLEGLQANDRVILSDMKDYEKYDRVTLK